MMTEATMKGKNAYCRMPEVMVTSLNGMGVRPLPRITQAPYWSYQAFITTSPSGLPVSLRMVSPTGVRK